MFLRRWKIVVAVVFALLPAVMISGCGGGTALLNMMEIASAVARIDHEDLTSKNVIKILADISGYTAVREVVASIKKVDGGQSSIKLTMEAPGQYSGEVPIDSGTTSTEAQNYTVVVTATDTAGNTVQSDPLPVEAPSNVQ